MVRRRSGSSNHEKLFAWIRLLVITGVFVVLGIGISSYWNRSWKGKERFTIIKMGKEITIESFDPVTNDGIKLAIPPSLMIETVGGKGKWRAGVLSELAQKYGQQWAADSVADTLGVNYIILGNLNNWWDRWSWWSWEKKIDWKESELDKSSATKDEIDLDGEKVLTLSESSDNKMREWFLSSALASEEIPITIINTVDVEGLGNHAARTVENSGIRVNEVQNSNENTNKCALTTPKDLKDSLTVKWIASLFRCAVSESNNSNKEVIVKLGQSYAAWWKGI